MKILAIDPGNTISAWCEYEDGSVRRSDKVANEVLLANLRRDAPGWTPELLAIEMIAHYGMAVGKEVFDTCLAIGRFIEAWSAARGGTVRLIYRKDVKVFLCNSARATDSNIRASIIDRYGPGKERAIGRKHRPGPLYAVKGDAWSALAVALTAEEHERIVEGRRQSDVKVETRTTVAEAHGQPF